MNTGFGDASRQVAVTERTATVSNPFGEADLPTYTVQENLASNAPISLKFAENIEPCIRKRIDYAFRVFAAIYGYRVVDADSRESSLCCIYGRDPTGDSSSRSLHLPARYRLQRHSRSSEQTLARFRYANQNFCLFNGVDEVTKNPDWLGEIFQWLSSSDEIAISSRDPESRIPYADTIFARQQISPRKPYATMLMAWFDNYLKHGNSIEAFQKAPSPVPGVEHLVICSHDIDFYYTKTSSTLLRLLKNLVISLAVYKSWECLSDSFKMLRKVLAGSRVGHYLPSLLSAMERYQTHSTFFVVARKGHRRDPNYRLEEIAAYLAAAVEKGFSVDLHASYESVVETQALSTEAAHLQNVLGKRPQGSRQHWLRFDTHKKLFAEIAGAKLMYDSTLGFPETPGFRTGASFAFPPYDFENEKPYPFLEIPLVLMDGNVEAASRLLGEHPLDIAQDVLLESRSWGWGGVAILWHNPMEALSVPGEINRVFWTCIANQRKHHEKWMSAEQFLNLSLGRYQAAGLMKEARPNA